MILVLHNLLCSVIPKYNGAVNRDQKQKSWPQLFCPKEYINSAVTAKPYYLASESEECPDHLSIRTNQNLEKILSEENLNKIYS